MGYEVMEDVREVLGGMSDDFSGTLLFNNLCK
jgi:hypothetical protein